MAEKYTLKLESLYGNDEPSYMTRGHHDRGTFADAVCVETGFRPDVALVRQLWWRTVPDGSGEFKYRYFEATPKSRGSFPVTVYEEI